MRETVDKKGSRNVYQFNNDCIKELKILWTNKLTTSLEENNQAEQVARLKIEIKKATDERDKNQDLYKKYVEETQE